MCELMFSSFSLAHELQCRLLVSRIYSLGHFKHKCVDIVPSEEAWTSNIGYKLIRFSATYARRN